MKKTFLMLLTVLAGFVSAHAANGVTVGAVTLSPNGTGTIDIELNNDDYVFTAFSFNLTLPTGLSFVLNNSNKPTFEQSNRFNESHQVSSSVSGQVGTFTCLSQYKDAFTGTSGVLLKVLVRADAGLAIGTNLEATLSEITFTTTGVTEVPFDDVTVNIAITEKVYTILDETSTTAPVASGGSVDIKVKRTIKANEWSTLVLPFDMTEAQLKEALGSDVKLAEFKDYEADYTGDDVTGLTVNFVATDLTEGFYGNYPYLVKTSADITEFIVTSTIDPDEEGAVAEYDNGKTGKQRKVLGSLIGTYHAGDAIPADGLFLSGNQFWYSTGETRIKAFRAYFMFVDVLTEVEGASANIRYTVYNEATGIADVKSPMGASDGWYTLDGRRLDRKPAERGVYIMDGKKVSIR